MPKHFLALLFVLITSLAWGQPSQKEKLEQRKAQILREIQEKERMLDEVRDKEKTVKTQLQLQTEKISSSKNSSIPQKSRPRYSTMICTSTRSISTDSKRN
jgi:septal ring factor EnvC (AmiA/AmiB activator)